ncbi:MAG: phosphodiester glycosidase family protein [Bacillota bacterium]
MLTKSSGIVKKIVLLLILTGFIFVFLSSNVWGENTNTFVDFARSNQRFVDNINYESSSFSITPTKEINLKDGENSVKLKRNEQYFIEMIETEDEKNYLSIQVIASSDREKVETIENELQNYGFTNNRIVHEDGLYKLQSGQLKSRDDAEEYRKSLNEIGFEGWIVGEAKDLYNFIIRDSSGMKIYQSSEIELSDAEFYFDDYWLAGDFKVFQKDDKIKMSLFVPINLAVAGNIAELENSYDRKFTDKELELLSIFLRTNLYGYFYKLDNSIINKEVRFEKPDSRIIDQVKKTKDMFIADKGNIAYQDNFYQTGYLKTLFNWFIGDFDKNVVVNNYDSEAEIINIMDYSKVEKLVDARIQRGLNYKEIKEETIKGNRIMTIIELDLNRSEYKVKPALAKNSLSGLSDLVDIGRDNQALAGINGGFFENNGRPLGIYMEDGKIVTGKVRNLVRSTLLIDEYGNTDIGIYDWHANLSMPDSRDILISGANKTPENNQAVLINKYYGETAPQLRKNAVEVIVNAENYVIGVNRSHNLPQSNIPDEGYIIQANGEKGNRLGSLTRGDKLRLSNRFFPEPKLEGEIIHALSAGPQLLENGRINISSFREGFQQDVVYGNAPRSAIGITEDNKLLLVTVDGRQPERSIGMTLEELASFMIDLGAVKAMNLDGGASARMLVRGFTKNIPSSERNIGNALLILPNI